MLDLPELMLVDDAYNANPASMLAAVEALRDCASGRRVFVMGDMLELGGASESFHHGALRSVFASGIEVLVTVGAAMGRGVRSIERAPGKTRVIACEDAAAANDVLAGLCEPGDTVWVKGSRAIGLDRVVDGLRARSSPNAAVAQDDD